jgi:hypothetical protein
MARTIHIQVAARSKAWFCGRWLSGIAGLNPAGDTDVFLLWVLCVVCRGHATGRSLVQRILPIVICLNV